jgi:hypothetical protein
MSTAEDLLCRLAGVRKTGGSTWLALCPAHEDRSASLSIRETRDGVTLVHCFAMCESADVLAAVGLEFKDLYPPREPGVVRRQARYSASDLLQLLSEELSAAAIVLADVLEQRAVSEEQWQRFAAATNRVQRARDYLES